MQKRIGAVVMGFALDLTGQRFNRLVALRRGQNGAARKTRWVCQCDCGRVVAVFTDKLRGNKTKSCGCLNAELRNSIKTHGHSRKGQYSKEYYVWYAAKQRCTNPRVASYRFYGARGIAMCPEWISDFAAFFAHIGPRPDGTSIDRIDNDRGYEPGNVRWATPKEQAANRRSTPR